MANPDILSDAIRWHKPGSSELSIAVGAISAPAAVMVVPDRAGRKYVVDGHVNEQTDIYTSRVNGRPVDRGNCKIDFDFPAACEVVYWSRYLTASELDSAARDCAERHGIVMEAGR